MIEEKRCKGCGAVLPLTGFYRHWSNRDRLNKKCKLCVNKANNERKKKMMQDPYLRAMSTRKATLHKSSWRKEHDDNPYYIPIAKRIEAIIQAL